MKGLYFYKLVSPYQEDVTKDCKLTINEIDHNFKTLKDMDIKDISFDDKTNTISFVRNNGDTIYTDLSSMIEGITRNLSVEYSKEDGIVTISYNDEVIKIDGLITEETLDENVLTDVITDSTLSGLGSKKVPLGIASVEKTGTYKPAKKVIDKIIGDKLPHCNSKGDRYVTREEVSEYGYLYRYADVQRINADLKNGWRVPTKADWDNMLNAIEPCDEYRDHNSPVANQTFGKIAGKLLKLRDKWKNASCHFDVSCECGLNENIKLDDEDFNLVDEGHTKIHPNRRMINPRGTDVFGVGLVPSGIYDGCKLFGYFGERGVYWSTKKDNETDIYTKRFDFNKASVVQMVESPMSAFSLRLVKDYDGSNFSEVEEINGMNYGCALVPTLNTEHGYSIWTTTNVAYNDEKYNPIEPNNGDGLETRVVYFINNWNGFNWERKQIQEGESIVLLTGETKGDFVVECRVINGNLISVTDSVYNRVMEVVGEELDEIHDQISGLTEDIHGEGGILERLKAAEDDIDTLEDGLKTETNDRVEADRKLQEAINKEADDRFYADTVLDEKIEAEKKAREEADTALQTELDTTQASVGLDKDGNYVPTEGNYTSGSTTIAEAIDLLDTALKIEGGEREDLQKELDATQESIGLDEEGNYIPTDGKFTSASTTVIGAVDALDKSLEKEEEDRIKKDDYLEGRLIKSGTHPNGEDGSYIAFDCAKGVLTLTTENPDETIYIKLNGDYGVIPFNGETD